ncbi:MAG: hypothetical protein IJX28_09090 [Clostridia bacterium]|nr:hypothetical protein [Clostridia bacterium]
MRKALLFFMGLVFVCCVYCYGTNERFSFMTWVENVKDFGETLSVEQLVECWTKDSYTFSVFDMPYSLQVYDIREVATGGTAFVYLGEYPLAYRDDYSLTKKYRYDWRWVYNENGTLNINSLDDQYGGMWPVITQNGETIFYETYEGTDETLAFLDSIAAFFKRLGRTIKLFAEMLVDVFKNMRLLLPWNSTVVVE